MNFIKEIARMRDGGSLLFEHNGIKYILDYGFDSPTKGKLFFYEPLLPCPFCGNDPEWINEALSDGHYHIRCPECKYVIKADRRDKVIGIWNNRVHPDMYRLKAENERLKEQNNELTYLLEFGINYLPTGWVNGKDGGFMYRDRLQSALNKSTLQKHGQ